VFYLFPCSHGIHSDCLIERSGLKSGSNSRFRPYLDSKQITIVNALQEQLKTLTARIREVPSDRRAQAQLEYLQSELDGYIAADCPYCGYAMIESLAETLIGENDLNEAKFWEL
jgi:hypothetical protein